MQNTTCPVSVDELLNDNGLTVAEEAAFIDEVEKMKPTAFLALIGDEEILQEAVDANLSIIYEMINESAEGVNAEKIHEMKNFEIIHLAKLAIQLINGIEDNLKELCEEKAYELVRN
jgi:hypothetical protein